MSAQTSPLRPRFVDDGLWFKDAIIYQLHVKAFRDSNGDGVGDFAGLTERLDYLRDLGVTTLWLLPSIRSPAATTATTSPITGTSIPPSARCVTSAALCKRRNPRLARSTELVINHTSDQHDWFKRAKRSRPAQRAHWYV